MEKVRVGVKGIQKVGTEATETYREYSAEVETDGRIIIKYIDEENLGQGKFMRIEATGEEMFIFRDCGRMGVIHLEVGKSHECFYTTEYINATLSFIAKRIENTFLLSGTLKAEYNIYSDGAIVSSNYLEVKRL